MHYIYAAIFRAISQLVNTSSIGLNDKYMTWKRQVASRTNVLSGRDFI